MTVVLVADRHNPDRRRYRELLPDYELVFCDGLVEVQQLLSVDPRRLDAALVLWQPAGAEIVAFLKRRVPALRIIAVDETLNSEIFKVAQSCGAVQFVMKPLDKSLTQTVRQVLGEESLEPVLRKLQERLVGESQEWRQTLEQLVRVLRAGRQTVLITGETGTGKELAARAVHELGERGARPFVAINAATVQPSLLESELFGHEKGAFTDAKERHQGVFEECGDGTLFLDEIGDFPELLQAKLLRVLQERVFRRLGGNKDLRFEGRLVFATNKDLESMVHQERFRNDLLHRINTHHVHLPALRERRDDWLLLAHHFLRKHQPRAALILSPAVRAVLADCDFPGNARQLENAILHCLTYRPVDQILPGQLPPDLLAKKQETSSEDELIFPAAWLDLPQKEASEALEQTFNRQYLPRLLASCHGKVTRAAAKAKIDPHTFRAKWQKAGLPPLNERE